MANHIFFIPWNGALADEQRLKCQNWNNSSNLGELKHNHPYFIVEYGNGFDMSGLLQGSEIYVRGHGAPGSHTLSNDVNDTDVLKYDEVADRLLSHGLKNTWIGRIKLYNCNSGACTLGRQSFAAKFAQYMRFKKGYHLVSYVGYFGSIDSYPHFEGAASHHKHKFSTRFKNTRFQKEVKTKWCKTFF